MRFRFGIIVLMLVALVLPFNVQTTAAATPLVSGFDTCSAPPVSTMQTWRTYSPFGYVAIYMGGVARVCNQPNLSATWVSQVSAQGWGLIPIWAGPQAPCLVSTGISYNLTTAYNQGVNEATAALNTATSLGLSSPIIYYDLEAYNYSIASCRDAVNSFLNGWTDRLESLGAHSGGYSTASAINTWGTIPNPPEAVWVAAWNSSASAYPLSGTAGTLWNNRQIHQYRGDHNETYGGVVINIDSDYCSGAPLMVNRTFSDNCGSSTGTPGGNPVISSATPNCVTRTGSVGERTLILRGSGFPAPRTSQNVQFRRADTGATSIYIGGEVTWVSSTQIQIDMDKIDHILWNDTRVTLQARLTAPDSSGAQQAISAWSPSFDLANQGGCGSTGGSAVISSAAPSCVTRTGTVSERTLVLGGSGFPAPRTSQNVQFRRNDTGATSIYIGGEVTWVSSTQIQIDMDKIDHILWNDTKVTLSARLTAPDSSGAQQAISAWSPAFDLANQGGCGSTGTPNNLLNMGYIHQYQGWGSSNCDCGPTDVAMIARHFGRSGLGDRDLVGQARGYTGTSTGTCTNTSFSQLEAALSAYGFTYSEISQYTTPAPDAQMQAMKNATAAGKPVIALIHGATIGRGTAYGDHWVVVLGFSGDGQWVYLNDPDNQPPRNGSWIQGGHITMAYSTFRQAAYEAQNAPYGIIVNP